MVVIHIYIPNCQITLEMIM